MSSFNIGGKQFHLPESDAGMTAMINRLTDLNESGQLKGLLVVYASDDSFGGCVLGDVTHQVFCSVMGSHLVEEALDRITSVAWSKESNKDDEDD